MGKQPRSISYQAEAQEMINKVSASHAHPTIHHVKKNRQIFNRPVKNAMMIEGALRSSTSMGNKQGIPNQRANVRALESAINQDIRNLTKNDSKKHSLQGNLAQ